jgi:hypothetical protein
MALTAQAALSQTRKLYDQIASRQRDVARADDYYRGKQPLRFASDKWREYHAGRYVDFSDNWCQPVANSPNERLRVDGFRLDDDPERSDAEKSLWRDWQANDMEAQSSQGFLSSIIARRSYVLVWGDSDNTPVATWERADQAAVGYDAERPGRRVAALKTWTDGENEFATLYTDDEVWKWQRPYLARNTGVAGPRGAGFFETTSGLVVPVTDSTGWKPRAGVEQNPMRNPLGVVPMVEIPNRPMLGAEPLSDIAGTMAMQDAINLLWAYLFTAADFASMPARVVMGQEPPKIPILDADGQKVGEKVVDLKKLAEDRILWLTGDNTKIGQWDAAKLDVFTGVIETAVTHIAAQTRTPPHYLVLGKGLVNVNAEGMKTAETGLVMKVKEMQTFMGPSTREVFRLFALVRDNAALAEQCRFGVVQWRDAENHSEAQLVDALVKLQTVGFPFPWLAERYGLSQTELARVMAMREAEMALDPVAALVRQTPPVEGVPVEE